MRNNQPHLLRELWHKKTLQSHVLREVEEAVQTYFTLRRQGVDEMTAKEIRLNILAPAEAMDIDRKEVIGDKMFEMILDEVTS